MLFDGNLMCLKPQMDDFQGKYNLMQRDDSFEKTLMLERLKVGGAGEDRGWRLDGITDAMGMSLSKLWEMVEDREAGSAVVTGSSTTATTSAPNRREQLEEKETSPSSRHRGPTPAPHPAPPPQQPVPPAHGPVLGLACFQIRKDGGGGVSASCESFQETGALSMGL